MSPAQVTPRYRRHVERERRANMRKRRQGLHPTHQLHKLARQGMAASGFRQTGLISGEWDISAGCTDPVPVVLNGAAARLVGRGYVRKEGRSYTLTLQTRCRKCRYCLRHKQRLWAARGACEIGLSQRTWFATFTLSPQAHFQMSCRAAARLLAGGTFIEQLPREDQLSEVVREIGAELTKYFKRVRKNTGAKLRYILTTELHKSGLPHFHALIHEEQGSDPVRKADLAPAWKLGFTQFKLVNNVRSAWYVAKYISKSAASRVRASLHYGNPAGEEKTPCGPSSVQRQTCNTATPTPINGVGDLSIVDEKEHAFIHYPDPHNDPRPDVKGHAGRTYAILEQVPGSNVCWIAWRGDPEPYDQWPGPSFPASSGPGSDCPH